MYYKKVKKTQKDEIMIIQRTIPQSKYDFDKINLCCD